MDFCLHRSRLRFQFVNHFLQSFGAFLIFPFTQSALSDNPDSGRNNNKSKQGNNKNNDCLVLTLSFESQSTALLLQRTALTLPL